MTINERFERIINALYNGNKRAFATSIGVSATVVENVVGKRQGKPSYDVLVAVCACANISAHWLLTGEGEMIEKKVTKPTPAPTNETESDAYLRGQIDALNKSNKELQDNLRMLYKEVGRLEERLKTATASLPQKDT